LVFAVRHELFTEVFASEFFGVDTFVPTSHVGFSGLLKVMKKLYIGYSSGE